MGIVRRCGSRSVRLASRRLMWALREAAGIPRIDVLLDYRDGHATVSEVGFGAGKWRRLDQLQENPPASDIRVIVEEEEVARAEWDGGGIRGRVDPHGAMDIACEDDANVQWEEWVEFQGREHPGGQLPLFPPKRDPDWEKRNEEVPPFAQAPSSEAPLVSPVPVRPESVANRLLVVRDAHAADFASALGMWVQNLASKLAEFEQLELDQYVRCEECESLVGRDTAAAAWGDYYCENHAPDVCEKCEEPIPRDETNYDDSGYPYCNECYSDTGEIWDSFYEEHPHLRDMEALEQAEGQYEMEPEVYVEIFRDLDWSEAYGGDAWAHIAETWRDLKAAIEREDWVRMHVLVDHAFDLVHNTGSLFTKASEGVKAWLFQALEDKFFLDPLQYRGKLSADARKLLDLHIRYSGGMAKWKQNIEDQEKTLDRFEKALLKEQDGGMAERLWRVHRMDPNMFRGRNAFLEVAFWSSNRTQTAIYDARKVRTFLHAPDSWTAFEVMAAIRPEMCKAGTSHPAGKVLREEFVPQLLKLIAGDPALRRELGTKESDEVSERVLGRGITKPWHWDEWGEFLKVEKQRQKELEGGVVAALASAFLKVALNPTDFYDFYALSAVDCAGLDDDAARMCRGLQKITTLSVAEALLLILSRAVIREARHVSDQLRPSH